MYKNKTLATRIAVFSGLLALSAMPALAQTSPKIELPKVEDARIIAIAYNRQGQGRVSAADRDGRVHQYMEVWENKSKIPNVVTYILVGTDRQTFYSITWGKGPVNTDAFTCKATALPVFDEKSLWVATVSNRLLTFTAIDDDDVKGLFSNLTSARRDWDVEVNATNQKRNANLTQNNILGFLKKKNREKWLANGWLQPAHSCVMHF